MNIKMRRFKQLLPLEETFEILKNVTNGVLALSGNEDYPYAVPVSYAYDGENIFIHSAISGHKINCLKDNSKVSFCVIKEDNVVPEEFTTYFKSVIVFGTATFLTETTDIIYGLKLLCEKYSPGIDSDAEIEKCLPHVAVIKISVDEITGKESIELTRNRPKK